MNGQVHGIILIDYLDRSLKALYDEEQKLDVAVDPIAYTRNEGMMIATIIIRNDIAKFYGLPPLTVQEK